MKSSQLLLAMSFAILATNSAMAKDQSVYADFPITLKTYEGDKKSSVSYEGQIARHVLHTSLKKLLSEGNGEPNEALKTKLMGYYSGKEAGRLILAPQSQADFPILQTQIDELSKERNLADSAYKGVVAGWPGNMTGAEVLAFMLEKAASSKAGYDPLTGYDYGQLFSKTLMGAVFYNQAVDKYLDEPLASDEKSNDQPYKEGAYYTTKEHFWDEAFGYFGAPINAGELDAKTAYAIAKSDKAVFNTADVNKDGKIDLVTEMIYGYAYYAADADKSQKTRYLSNIMTAFIAGRQLIADAKGEKLTPEAKAQLLAYAETIKSNWEQVIAEAAYKYAGSVYNDLKTIIAAVKAKEDLSQLQQDYAKHWGELKGFILALQMGGKDLGETAVTMNRLTGFSPVSLSSSQVTAIDDKGGYTMSKTRSMEEYMLHMAKLQQLLQSQFELKALKNEITDDLATLEALSEKLGEKTSAEND